MRRIREVLRVRHELKLTQRQISASTGMSKSSVHDYLRRAEQAGLRWEAARAMDDAAVEAKLFHAAGWNEPPRRLPIDLPHVHGELGRAGVTLQLLWLEYRELHLVVDMADRRASRDEWQARHPRVAVKPVVVSLGLLLLDLATIRSGPSRIGLPKWMQRPWATSIDLVVFADHDSCANDDWSTVVDPLRSHASRRDHLGPHATKVPARSLPRPSSPRSSALSS
jgi:hypothetical protein